MTAVRENVIQLITEKRIFLCRKPSFQCITENLLQPVPNAGLGGRPSTFPSSTRAANPSDPTRFPADSNRHRDIRFGNVASERNPIICRRIPEGVLSRWKTAQPVRPFIQHSIKNHGACRASSRPMGSSDSSGGAPRNVVPSTCPISRQSETTRLDRG